MVGLDHLKGLFLNNDGILLPGFLCSKISAMLPCDIATQQSHKLWGAGSAPPYIQFTSERRKIFLPHRNAMKIKNLKFVRCLDITEVGSFVKMYSGWFFLNSSSFPALGLHSTPNVPIFLHQDENTQRFGKLSVGPEHVFQQQDLTDTKYLQGQIGGKRSVSTVNDVF